MIEPIDFGMGVTIVVNDEVMNEESGFLGNTSEYGWIMTSAKHQESGGTVFLNHPKDFHRVVFLLSLTGGFAIPISFDTKNWRQLRLEANKWMMSVLHPTKSQSLKKRALLTALIELHAIGHDTSDLVGIIKAIPCAIPELPTLPHLELPTTIKARSGRVPTKSDWRAEQERHEAAIRSHGDSFWPGMLDDRYKPLIEIAPE